MADEKNSFGNSVSSLLNGLEGIVSSKTVIGEPVVVGDAVILPLVDMKFGVGAGAFSSEKKNNSAGGLGASVSPCAVLIIQNGMTKVVNIKNQDVTSKIVDMVPDLVNRFTKGRASDPAVDQAVDGVLHPDTKKQKGSSTGTKGSSSGSNRASEKEAR